MLSNIEIINFRMFKHLKLDKLARVNLISGKNNSGKSAFLEAIFIHNSDYTEQAINKVLNDREETLDRGVSNISHIRHLFPGHKVDIDNFQPLRINSNKDKTFIDLGYTIIERSNDEGIRKNILSVSNDINKEIALFDLIDENIKFIIGSEKKGSKDIPLYSFESELDLFSRMRASRVMSKNTLLVPSSGTSFDDMAILWDKISLTDLEKHITSALGLIDNRVRGVAMVQSSGSNKRIPVVKLSHLEEPVTLKSLGDGMGRIFRIILSLVNCKGGILLIDEFENGLHWSVQDKIWDIVFTLARKLNVQIFCTTHSRDCLASFRKSWSKHEGDGCYFRIENKFEENQIKIRKYEFDLLESSLDLDVEVR